MARGAARRAATALAVAALAARCAHSQTFTTDLKGLGGTQIGQTPLNTPGVSVMNAVQLTADPLVSSRASGSFH